MANVKQTILFSGIGGSENAIGIRSLIVAAVRWVRRTQKVWRGQAWVI